MLQATLKFFFSAPSAGCTAKAAHSKQVKTAAVRRKCNHIETLEACALQCKAYAAPFEGYCRDSAHACAPFGGAVGSNCSAVGQYDGTGRLGACLANERR